MLHGEKEDAWILEGCKGWQPRGSHPCQQSRLAGIQRGVMVDPDQTSVRQVIAKFRMKIVEELREAHSWKTEEPSGYASRTSCSAAM
jgi:hypothetical protein